MKLYICILTAAIGLTGCIDTSTQAPEVAEPMCYTNEDCDVGAGAICDEGVCWGGPPEAQFGAVLLPPADRDDLVPSEVALLDITADGTVSGLLFANTVTFSGRVTLASAPDVPVAAQVKIQRPSRIPGGPTYARTVVAQPRARADGPAFSLRVPRLEPGEAPYVVTVIPDDGTLAEPGLPLSPADLAPPLRLSFDGQADRIDTSLVLSMGSGLKQIEGRVVDAANRGLAGMRVTALGRWTPDGARERVSSRANTADDGSFTIWIPLAMDDTNYEVLVRPPTGMVAPTLRVRDVSLPDPDSGEPLDLGALTMPSYPSSARYTIPVRAAAPEGGVGPVEGAEVQVSTTLLAPADANSGGVSAVFTASGVTDAEGNVVLELLPGSTVTREYVVSVYPVATGKPGSLYGAPLLVGLPGADGGVLAPVTLGSRVPVSGEVRTAEGEPVASAAITTSTDAGYRWGLDPELQSQLDDVRMPTATTDGDGRFVIWLDESLVGVPASYDLQIAPPPASLAPRWSRQGLLVADAKNSDGQVNLHVITLPAASFARGNVRDPAGAPVPGAEVKLYEISRDDSLCGGVSPPPTAGGMVECVPPALLRQVTQADTAGRAVLVLPDDPSYP